MIRRSGNCNLSNCKLKIWGGGGGVNLQLLKLYEIFSSLICNCLNFNCHCDDQIFIEICISAVHVIILK